MAGQEPVSAERMSKQGKDIRKPEATDAAAAAQIMDANRIVQEERRNAERKIAAERDRARQEIERIRADADRKLADMTAERRILLKTLSQLQIENEAQEREVMLLKAKLQAVEWIRAGYVPPPAPHQAVPHSDLIPGTVPVQPVPPDGLPSPGGSMFRSVPMPESRPQ